MGALRWSFVVAALVCAAPVACGSFGEAGSGPASTTTDGGMADGGMADGAVMPDASTKPCAHAFCASFDGPSAAAEWPSSREDVGPLMLDTVHFVSPPSALRVTAGPDAAKRIAYVEKTFAAAQRYRFSAMVRLETPGTPNGEVDLVDLEFDPPPDGFARYFVGLVGMNTGELMLQYQAPDDMKAPLNASAASFVRVDIDVDLDIGKLVVRISGDVRVDTSIAKAKSKGITLSVGLPYTDHTQGTYIANIDDVTFD